MNEKKYIIELSQEEMDQLVYALVLVLLKVDAINCLEQDRQSCIQQQAAGHGMHTAGHVCGKGE